MCTNFLTLYNSVWMDVTSFVTYFLKILSIYLFFFNFFLYFIGVQFTNIQNNTQCPSPIHSHPPPSSPSTTPSSFPRVSSLYVLSPFLKIKVFKPVFPFLHPKTYPIILYTKFLSNVVNGLLRWMSLKFLWQRNWFKS